MRNFIIGTCFGFFLGAAFATYGWSQAQSSPGNMYAPGSFMSDTLLQNAIISNDADAYLNQKYPGLYSVPGPSSLYPCPR